MNHLTPTSSDRSPSLLRREIVKALLCLSVVFGVVVGWTRTEAHDAATSFTNQPRESTVKKHLNWMSRLPDQASLAQLALPGTHNTCALRDGFAFGFAKCQSWRLADQLVAGVRFLDIRCRHVGDDFLIYHGIVDQQIPFASVRDECREFLKRHPSECIIMSLKEESTSQETTRKFSETFLELIRDDGNLWHLSEKVPTLNSVRGRIVLVDREGDLGGLPWGAMERQDNYRAEIDLKTKLIRKHLQQALTAEQDRWFINFCSGTLPGRFITPRNYAWRTNRTAFEFLEQPNLNHPLRLGIVVMDFPGEELIEKIVAANFAKE